MDMGAEKAKRDARIKTKNERIKNELGVTSDTGSAKASEVAEVKEVAKKK
jgi:hypothetical protein